MSNMSMTILFALGCGIAGVIYGIITAIWVNKQDAGNQKMIDISNAVKEGANAFLAREYKTVAMVAAVLVLVLAFVPKLGMWAAAGFIIGTVGSALAGFIGMWVSLRANVRTAAAASKGLQAALSLAFKGGSVTGIMVVGLGIIGLAGFYFVAKSMAPAEEVSTALIGLGFGCSLMSVFARIAGGIYTKAADVGADLVGKVEKNIPEDDPRNPAVIADNVGDNVGDCAGMAADLYETYTVTLVAAMLLAKTVFGADSPWIEFPLMLGGVSIIASIVGTYFVRLGKTNYIMGALYKGLAVAGVIAAVAFYFVSKSFIDSLGANAGVFTANTVFFISLIGLALTGLIVWITEYFTAKEYGPGAAHCTGEPHRPRHERDRRTRSQHEVHRSAGARDRCFDPRRILAWRRILRCRERGLGRHLRHRACSRVHAFHDRHRRGNRLLRSDHGQCGRRR